MLFNLCAGMVKQRTCFTNYAPLWANMKFLHDNFRLTQFSAIFYIYQIYLHCRTVYEDLGYPWSKFQDFLEKEQVAAMQSLHIETGFPFFIHWKIIHFCQTTLCPWSSATWLAFWSGPTSSQPTRWTKTKHKGDFYITICKTYTCWTKEKLANCTGSPARPPYQKVETWLQDRAWNQPSRYWLLKIIWKLILEEQNCKNAMYATLHLFRQSIWGIKWRLTLEKKCTNAKYATLNLFRQCIWGIIWNHLEKNRTNAMHATLTLWDCKSQKCPGEPALQMLKGAALKHLRPHIETLGGQVL